ncbi:bone morphogenetic protein 2-like isoform X2 [Oculina patagonica]
MFITLLYCLFFGATICLGVPDHSSTDKETKVAKAVEKAMLQNLDWKTQPKPKKGLKEKIPQSLLDLFHKQVNESEGTGMMKSDDVVQVLGKEKGLCRKIPLYIDFAKIGYDHFMIVPKGYQANYCDGECPPHPNHLNYTNHAVVIAHWNERADQPKVKPPCCAPTKMKPLHVMYQDEDGKTVKKDWQDMIVEECGCR